MCIAGGLGIPGTGMARSTSRNVFVSSKHVVRPKGHPLVAYFMQ